MCSGLREGRGVELFYILFGEDTFSRDGALREIKQGLGDEEFLSLNTTILDGQHLTWEQLTNACDSLPFLAPSRLVVVEGLLARYESQRQALRQAQGGRRLSPGEGEKSPWSNLKEYICQMTTTTALVMVDGKLSRNNPLLKELTSVAQVREFRPLRKEALRRWIGSQVSRLGGSITLAAVDLLEEAIGSNLGLMAQEIEKLCLYSLDGQIDDEAVRRLVSYAREANVFAMVDALMAQRRQVALQHLHQLLLEGDTASHLLAIIARQLRLAMEAKELIRKGLPKSEIGSRLELASDYALARTMEQARLYSMESLMAIHHRLLEIDLAIKRGIYREEMALDLLVVGFS
ncbi:MAG: DNA polymerase III subunit delta [Chloroflexi bacterium]|nr:DNA polymerase III subunit delta [Chloroflexota bacterium]